MMNTTLTIHHCFLCLMCSHVHQNYEILITYISTTYKYLDWKASMIYFTVKLKIGWQRMTQPIEIHVEYCLTQSCKRGMLLKSHMINLYKNCILWLRKYTSYEPEIFCAYGFHGRMKHTIRLCEYFLKFLRYGLVKSQEFIGRYYY